jgi:hypothetical protein
MKKVTSTDFTNCFDVFSPEGFVKSMRGRPLTTLVLNTGELVPACVSASHPFPDLSFHNVTLSPFRGIVIPPVLNGSRASYQAAGARFKIFMFMEL